MLNPNLHLDDKIFSDKPNKAALRDGFGKALRDLGRENKDVLAVCADLTESTRMHWFKEEFPERFFEVGISEQHMAAFASGLAKMGKIPFISSYAMFSPGRNWEQIRTTICYNNQAVKIVGSHAGVSVGPDGGTHQAIEDLAIMRVLPNMIVLAPSDANEAYKATIEAAKIDSPVYIRLAREASLQFSTESTEFKIGKIYDLYRSPNPQITIFATGTSVPQALRAAKILEENENVGTLVCSVPTVKPLDEISAVEFAQETGKVISVENHQVYGGLGSALAEVFAKIKPVKMRFVGIQDAFGQSGEPEELLRFYGLDAESIAHIALEFLKE